MLKRALGIIMMTVGLLLVFGGLSAVRLFVHSGPETAVRDWLLAFGIVAGIAWFIVGMIIHIHVPAPEGK